MSEENKCPKCGSAVIKSFKTYTEFACRSDVGCSVFYQSEICKERSLRTQIATLTAKLEKARKALEPFARMIPASHMDVPDDTEVTWGTAKWNGPSEWSQYWKPATVGDLRLASTTLEETK
jgi:hypothetical protein